MKYEHDLISFLVPRFEGFEKEKDWMKSEDDFLCRCNSQLYGAIAMHIRNEFGLWTKDTEVYKVMIEKFGEKHPDELSEIILKDVYKILYKKYVLLSHRNMN